MASNEYSFNKLKVISQLTECFGKTLAVDVINSVAYACHYDISRASNQLIEMSSNLNTGPVPLIPHSSVDDVYQRELDLQRVIQFVKEGWKVLILMRGLPGSGKTCLANLIFNESVPSYSKNEFILSTDDFFHTGGGYEFKPHNLPDAHAWNQRRCFSSMRKGISPIIIDNTNTQLWEMRPYCLMGAEYGYCIEVVEPMNWWQFNVQALAEKNIHHVSRDKIIEMLARYEKNLTPDLLSKMCDLRYKHILPQRRRVPPVMIPQPIFENATAAWVSNSNFGGQNSWNSSMRMNPLERNDLPARNVPIEYVHPVESKHEEPIASAKVSIPEYVHEFKTTDHMREINAPQVNETPQTRLASVDDLLAFQDNNVKVGDSQPIENELGPELNAASASLPMDTSDGTTWNPNPSHEEFKNLQETIQNAIKKLAESPSLNLATESASEQIEESKLADRAPDDTKEKSFNPYSPSNLTAWDLTEKALVSWEVVSPLPAVSSAQLLPQIDSTARGDVQIKKTNQSTNTSASDFSLAKLCPPMDGLTILTSQNRIITEGIVSKPSTPPKKILIDQSSMTTNEDLMVTELKHENPSDEHLKKLIQLFPNIPTECLEDVYVKCVRDINWTVDLLMENDPGNLCTAEVELVEDCDNQNNKTEENVTNVDANEEMNDLISFEGEYTETTPLVQKENMVKIVKEENMVEIVKEENMVEIVKEIQKQQERASLKKFLEDSIDIKKSHYSDKLWQIVNFKRGTPIKPDGTLTKQPENAQTSTQQYTQNDAPSAQMEVLFDDDTSIFVSDDEAHVNDNDDGGEDDNLVEINLGQPLVTRLEKMFGESDMGNFDPIVQMPESFARQLHALYLESICRQLENQCEAMEVFVKEDEAYAKKLQEEEERTLIQNQPGCDLKEIMDEQLALNLHRKDVDKWRESSPDDLAAKLTRQKLFETFPTLPKDLLVEILQAHDNCYKQTVETLLDSTDPQNVQGNKENLREPPISDNVLQEMKLAQNDIAALLVPIKENTPRSAASYRHEANVHLQKRIENLKKVQMYSKRGMNEVAAFYANIARQQLQLVELANQKASCRFLEENAVKLSNGTTLDLHYLYVKEALPTLDIFIDHHISRLVKSKKPTDYLYVITGRGKRSEGGVSRLKPVVINRLKKRQIQYQQMNLGLLRIKIHKNLLMSTNLSI